MSGIRIYNLEVEVTVIIKAFLRVAVKDIIRRIVSSCPSSGRGFRDRYVLFIKYHAAQKRARHHTAGDSDRRLQRSAKKAGTPAIVRQGRGLRCKGRCCPRFVLAK